jgi:hypothetical protein
MSVMGDRKKGHRDKRDLTLDLTLDFRFIRLDCFGLGQAVSEIFID